MKASNTPPSTGAVGDDDDDDDDGGGGGGGGGDGCLAPSSAGQPGPVQEPVPEPAPGSVRDLIGRAKLMLQSAAQSAENEDYQGTANRLVLALGLIDRSLALARLQDEANQADAARAQTRRQEVKER